MSGREGGDPYFCRSIWRGAVAGESCYIIGVRSLCTYFVLTIAAASLHAATSVEQYQVHDFTFRAPVEGNPFEVELAGEFAGPGGVWLRVPGFYDGDGVWKIRFSPTRPGDWTLRTVSPAAALNGKQETVTCTANHDPQIHGGLLVDPAHPHHFVYEDGTRYFLMGYEADWLWAIDMLDPDRKAMHHLIDQTAARGFNHVIVNVYAHDTTWSPGRQNQWDYGPPALFAWEGSNERPDHARLNPRFFQLYDGMMRALQEKGIVAHIMLKVYNKLVNWPAPGSAEEQRWFRYVVARYQAFSNVVWDFSKESRLEEDVELHARLIDAIRAADAYHRLTTTHDDNNYYWDPRLSANVDFQTDQQHSDWAAKVAFERNRRAYPIVNAEFGYEHGVEDLPTYRVKQDWQEVLRRAWLIYMAGGYGVYYYSNTAWDLVKPDPEPPGMQRFALLKQVLSALPYWRMEPSDSLAVGGPCLALNGEAYACYAAQGTLTVNLTALDRAPSRAEWIDTWTGARENVSVERPGIVTVRRPAAFGEAPALLIVQR
jgi:hypothetical protein